MFLPALFIVVGSVTLLSVGYRFLADMLLRRQILTGRATAAEVLASVGLDTLDDLDELREREPALLEVVPGSAGPYEDVEFSFSPRRLRKHRRASLAARLRSIPVHLAALSLVVVALAANHRTAAGWVALLAAFFIELLRWGLPRALARSRRQATAPTITTSVHIPPPDVSTDESRTDPRPAADGPAFEDGCDASSEERAGTSAVGPEVVDDPGSVPAIAEGGVGTAAGADRDSPGNGDAADEDADPDAGEPPPPSPANLPARLEAPSDSCAQLRTIVLIRAPWRPVAAVFHASLRRAGQRDAVLPAEQPADEAIVEDVGRVSLRLAHVSDPVDAQTIEIAAAQSSDWPDAARWASDHVAHLTLDTVAGPDTSRADVVRIHQRAHAALTDFAPVIAALWPEAGRLVPAERLAELAAESGRATSPLESCVIQRTLPPDGSDRGWVFDTVGLHAFGLPDVQITADNRPDAAALAALQEVADGLFCSAIVASDGCVIRLTDGSAWRVALRDAQVPPDRQVVHLEPVRGDMAE